MTHISIVGLAGRWEFRLQGRPKGEIPLGLTHWMPAEVPGTVHFQLGKAKKIPDPFYAQNERDLQWIDQQDWEWSRSFSASEEDCAQSRQELIFDGIDTIAEIFLNGRRIGRSVNMFRRVVCDARGILRAGNNELRVVLKSPTAYALREAKRAKERVPIGDFAWAPGEKRLTGRAWIRKVQCHFGWDWGVYLATSGIWQDVRLECSDAPRISAITVEQEHIGPAGKPRQVKLHVTAYLDSPDGARGELEISCGKKSVGISAKLRKGESSIRGTVAINQPKLWWPHGQGEQSLYRLDVQWRDESGATAEATRRIGLRTVELVRKRDKTDQGEKAESFYFRINGRPVFAKGVNWIPADQFVEKCTPALYRHLLHGMIEANMNMVRIWGGGWYEQDSFYDLCDELGIMVWQDFMMACALYPDTAEFLEELKAEARYQVRRLHARPSIVLWCGDNENMEAVWQWWRKSPNFETNTQIYKKVMTTLEKVAEAEDSTRAFWVSSPSNGEFGEGGHNPHRGDVHYWRVWHQRQPFSNYLTVRPRFASEFGFQSFPEPRTIRAVIPPGDLNVSSRVMEHHQRSPDGNMLIASTIARELAIPKDFDMYCWASQINQAMAIRTAVEHWRRLRPWCMGTLFWQLNDLWPVASWSSIDYHGRWKVLQHFAGRFFAPLLGSMVHEGDHLTLWGTSDLAKAANISGVLEVFTWSGKPVARKPISGRLKAGQSRSLAKFSIDDLLNGNDIKSVCVLTRIAGGGQRHENFTALAPWKWITLPKPRVLYSLRNGSRGIELRARTNQVVPFFHAEIEGAEGHFDGDWQILRPGRTYTMPWIAHSDLGAEIPGLSEARKKLKTFSLYDTYLHEENRGGKSR